MLKKTVGMATSYKYLLMATLILSRADSLPGTKAELLKQLDLGQIITFRLGERNIQAL